MQFHVVIQNEEDLDILYETLLYFIKDHSPVVMKVTVEYDSKNPCDQKDAQEQSSATNTEANDETTQKSPPHELFNLEIKDEEDLDLFYGSVLKVMVVDSPMENLPMKITVEFDSTNLCDSKDSDENSEE